MFTACSAQDCIAHLFRFSPEDSSTNNPPQLTVEFVYRTALEEIMGDSNLSHEEEEVLKNLRDFLEIPPEQYQAIFQEVATLNAQGQSKKHDRDFSPEAFLFALLERTVADGKIDDDERAILAKVANGLMLSQDTFAQVFEQVKAKYAKK